MSLTIEQETNRLGKMTASMASVVMGGLQTDGLKRYIRQLAFNRVYGHSGEETFKSVAMERGSIVEAEALDWYAFTTDAAIEVGGFYQHPDLDYVAAMPDATLPDRNIEVKSPLHHNWVEVRETMTVPSEYLWQIRWQAWVRSVNLCDFVCYHPKAGGLILPYAITQHDFDQMAERAIAVNIRIEECANVLREKVAA